MFVILINVHLIGCWSCTRYLAPCQVSSWAISRALLICSSVHLFFAKNDKAMLQGSVCCDERLPLLLKYIVKFHTQRLSPCYQFSWWCRCKYWKRKVNLKNIQTDTFYEKATFTKTHFFMHRHIHVCLSYLQLYLPCGSLLEYSSSSDWSICSASVTVFCLPSPWRPSR